MKKLEEAIMTTKGDVLWEYIFYVGKKKYQAYVAKESNGKFSGVIDEYGTDNTEYGDEFSSKDAAMKKIKDEIKAMKDNQFEGAPMNRLEKVIEDAGNLANFKGKKAPPFKKNDSAKNESMGNHLHGLLQSLRDGIEELNPAYIDENRTKAILSDVDALEKTMKFILKGKGLIGW